MFSSKPNLKSNTLMIKKLMFFSALLADAKVAMEGMCVDIKTKVIGIQQVIFKNMPKFAEGKMLLHQLTVLVMLKQLMKSEPLKSPKNHYKP